MILTVDVSGSGVFGSSKLSKRELAAELAAIIAFCANINGDKIGLLLFANEPFLYLPPSKGTRHVLRIIREILTAEPEDPGTSINSACHFLLHTVKRKALVFMISDFIDHDFKKSLGAVANKHDTIALRIFDPLERKLPKVGKVTLTDPETGWQTVVNTNNGAVRMSFDKLTRQHHEGTSQLFKKLRIDEAQLSTTDDYLPALHKLFKTRTKHRK